MLYTVESIHNFALLQKLKVCIHGNSGEKFRLLEGAAKGGMSILANGLGLPNFKLDTG